MFAAFQQLPKARLERAFSLLEGITKQLTLALKNQSVASPAKREPVDEALPSPGPGVAFVEVETGVAPAHGAGWILDADVEDRASEANCHELDRRETLALARDEGLAGPDDAEGGSALGVHDHELPLENAPLPGREGLSGSRKLGVWVGREPFGLVIRYIAPRLHAICHRKCRQFALAKGEDYSKFHGRKSRMPAGDPSRYVRNHLSAAAAILSRGTLRASALDTIAVLTRSSESSPS